MRDRTYKSIKERVQKVSQDEIDKIRDDANNAKIILDNNFFLDYLEQIKKEIIDIHVKQLVYNAKEERDIVGGKKVIELPAEKEYQILAGQYRLAEKIVEDMKQIYQIGLELEKRIKDNTLEANDE